MRVSYKEVLSIIKQHCKYCIHYGGPERIIACTARDNYANLMFTEEGLECFKFEHKNPTLHITYWRN